MPDASKGSARAGFLLVGILLVSFLLRLPFVSVPLERDEGEYAYIAWLMSEGGVPYRDAFNQKPPGTFFVYFLIMKLFGFTVEGIHLGMTLWTLGTIALVYLIGRRLFSSQFGLLGAGAFSVASISPAVLGSAANTEIFMALPLAAAALFASDFGREGDRNLDFLFCGALIGLATTFKQVAVTDGLFFFGVMVLGAIGIHGWSGKLLVRTACFGAGVVLAWAPVFLYLLVEGAVNHFVQDAIVLNLSYSSLVPIEEYPDNFSQTLQADLIPYLWPYLLAAPIGVAVALTLKDTDMRTRLFLPGWLLFSLLGTSVGGIFREHYFIQTLPPLSLLVGVSLATAGKRITSTVLRMIICSVVVALPLLPGFRPFLALPPHEMSRAIYDSNLFVETLEAAEHVSRNSALSDKVLVLGSEPQILFYARRKSASRYIITYPLMMDVAGARDRQVEMFNETLTTEPRIIVAINAKTSHLYGPWTSDYIFRNLRALIERDYVRIYASASDAGGAPTIVVFRRKDRIPSAAP